MIDAENEIDQNDPQIQDNIRAAQNAVAIFCDVCRMHPESAPREEDLEDILNELYAKDGDIYDSVAWQLAWQRVRAQRRETARREVEREAQEQARRQEIEDYKRPSSDDLLALRGEMKSRQPRICPAVPVDLSHLSQDEFDATPDAELRRMLGADVRIEDRQSRGTGATVTEDLNALILAGKVINRAGVRKVKSIKFSQEELKAQEERARILAQGKAERRRLEQERRKR